VVVLEVEIKAKVKVKVEEEVKFELWTAMVALKRQVVSCRAPRTSRRIGNKPTEQAMGGNSAR
jgi:hypothetical protein